MSYLDFLWTDEIAEHLALHGVTPEEFEAIVCHSERRGESHSTGRPCCWGEVPDGSYLFCVYEYLDELTIIPFTAYKVRPPGE